MDQRRHKFRIFWEGKIVYPEDIAFDKDGELTDFIYMNKYQVKTSVDVRASEEKPHVMEASSWKDKNGKPIYEGDILAITDNYGERWLVKVVNGFYVEGGRFIEEPLHHLMNGMQNNPVISGNIYEPGSIYYESSAKD